MIIAIPQNFREDYKIYNWETRENDRVVKAYEKREKIYIEPGVPFRDLMMSMASKIQNHVKCAYCGEYVPVNEMVIDLKYPESLGGPIIPDNIVYSCKKCEKVKKDLTQEEYLEWKKLSKEKAKKYYESIQKNHEMIRKTEGILLPKEWVTTISIDKIETIFAKEDIRKKVIPRLPHKEKYDRLVKRYNQYGNFSEVMILDANLKLLDGTYLYLVVRELGITNVKVIILENVQLLKENEYVRKYSEKSFNKSSVENNVRKKDYPNKRSKSKISSTK